MIKNMGENVVERSDDSVVVKSNDYTNDVMNEKMAQLIEGFADIHGIDFVVEDVEFQVVYDLKEEVLRQMKDHLLIEID